MKQLLYFLIIITYFLTHTLAQPNNFSLAGLKAFEVTVNIDDLLLEEFGRTSDVQLRWDLERDLKRAGAEVLDIFDDFVESEHGKLITEINVVLTEPVFDNFKYSVIIKVVEEIPLSRLNGEYCPAITWENTITGMAQFNDNGWDLVKEKFEEATEIFIKDYQRDNRWR